MYNGDANPAGQGGWFARITAFRIYLQPWRATERPYSTMAQQQIFPRYATAALLCMAGLSPQICAQGWYGGPYGTQSPRMAPYQGYYPAPSGSAPRPSRATTGYAHDTLQAQFAASQQQLQDARSELQRTQLLLRQARAALEYEQSSAQQRSSMQHTFGNQLTHMSSRQDEVYAQVKQLTDEVSALKAPLIDNQTQLADIATIARTLNAERERMQSDADNRNRQISALRAEVRATQLALEKARSDASTIRDGLVKAELQVQSCETEIGNLRSELTDTAFDGDTSRQALKDALAARDTLQTELARCAVMLSQVRATPTTASASAESRHGPAGQGNASAGRSAAESAALMAAEILSQSAASDHDNDGIPDDADFCPETPDGIAVGPTGCDLPLPIVLNGVSFRVNSHQLVEDSFPVLDGVAGILARHPELKLEVADFTALQGDAAAGRKLSQMRAETVRNYLVGRGANADRLTAHGYGDRSPLSGDNKPDPVPPGRPVILRKVD